jgi:hypothetical protein
MIAPNNDPSIAVVWDAPPPVAIPAAIVAAIADGCRGSDERCLLAAIFHSPSLWSGSDAEGLSRLTNVPIRRMRAAMRKISAEFPHL